MSGLPESPTVREVGAETRRLGKVDGGPGKVVNMQGSPLMLTFKLLVLPPPLPIPHSLHLHCPASNPCPSDDVRLLTLHALLAFPRPRHPVCRPPLWPQLLRLQKDLGYLQQWLKAFVGAYEKTISLSSLEPRR